MLPDQDGCLRVNANVAGEVEIRGSVGQVAYAGQILAIVEGDHEIESLSLRTPSKIEEILVESGTEVPAGTTLMLVRELSD